jgi:CDP-paratose synthetase
MNLEHFYGRNAPNNFLSFIINQCNVNKDIPLTSGTQKRDFVYIDDVCNAFNSVITYRNKLQNFDTIDVGTGIAMPVKDVVLKIKELTKSNSKLLFGEIPLRDNEVGEMKANISKLQSLDWAPQYSIVSGLKEML